MRVDHGTISSAALRGNRLGDPSQRPVRVQVPAGYDDDTAALPVVYVLQGYFGRIEDWDRREPFRPTVPEAVDALAPRALVVYVDAWTAYGGSQFVDSPGTGNYGTYVADEIVAWVDARYRTRAEPAGRAVAGHSSGGFGAATLALTRPDVFSAFASHAGDSLHEYLYVPMFARAVRALRAHDGDIAAWWAAMADRPALSAEGDDVLAMVLGCAEAYTPGELPFDPRTGVLRPAVWQRWLDRDPVRLAAAHPETAAALRGAWLDGGTSDEYFLEIGVTALAAALRSAGLPPERCHHELFEGTHERTEYRFPLAIAWLATRLHR